MRDMHDSHGFGCVIDGVNGAIVIYPNFAIGP